MDPQTEIVNWKRLIITTLLVVVASAITSSITWFILDRTFNESQETNAALVATLEKKITYLDTRLGGSTATDIEVVTTTKKYTSSHFGLSFDYPSAWTAGESVSGEGGSVYATSPQGKSVTLTVNIGGRGFESVKYAVNYDAVLTGKKVAVSNRQLVQNDTFGSETANELTAGYVVLTSEFSYNSSQYRFIAFDTADTATNSYVGPEKALTDIISSFSFN